MLVDAAQVIGILASVDPATPMLVSFERDVGLGFDRPPKIGESVNVIMSFRGPYQTRWVTPLPPAIAKPEHVIALPADTSPCIGCGGPHGAFGCVACTDEDPCGYCAPLTDHIIDAEFTEDESGG